MSPFLIDDTFPQSFYDFIYGSVHHHQMEARADYLISRFGTGRYLDIGTGCGHLVKLLRDRGVEAYGIDVSDYAIANSCAPQWVMKGDIRDIPFADGFFDVVTSQAVHGYYPEADLDRAIAECKRVGHRQSHNVDTNCVIPAYGYQFMKPLEYWQEVFPDGDS